MKKIITIVSLLAFCACAQGVDQPTEEAAAKAAESEASQKSTAEKETRYNSPNGVSESCVALAKIPGGAYSQKDLEQENIFCAVDFYKSTHALCPKTWSTSPGTMIYDLTDSSYSPSSYEDSKYCGSKSKPSDVSTEAKFKQTMNASGTSGTLSQSSLLYYHFSRFFDANVYVPVSVYREMDKDIHRSRVTKSGVSKSSKAKMNNAGWKHLYNAEAKPTTYSPTDDLFTNDRTKIYGIMVRGKGERYGTEFNGTRASGWGKGQNRDFQKTPGFRALRDSSSLLKAIDNGINSAATDSKMRKDLVGLDGSQGYVQVAFWMREIIELTLMDYIFSQQDRIGNIDYRWYWAYIEDGKTKYKREKRDQFEELPRKSMGKITPPTEIASLNPILIQRTQINDNDAGGRVAYANFTKSTGMLDGLEHYSAKLYNRLMKLDKDLQSKGPVYQWLNNSIDLTTRRVNQVVSNTNKAANILRAQCSGMKFDLDDVDNLYTKGERIETVDCSQ